MLQSAGNQSRGADLTVPVIILIALFSSLSTSVIFVIAERLLYFNILWSEPLLFTLADGRLLRRTCCNENLEYKPRLEPEYVTEMARTSLMFTTEFYNTKSLTPVIVMF